MGKKTATEVLPFSSGSCDCSVRADAFVVIFCVSAYATNSIVDAVLRV